MRAHTYLGEFEQDVYGGRGLTACAGSQARAR
jgi:hypothetical protein